MPRQIVKQKGKKDKASTDGKVDHAAFFEDLAARKSNLTADLPSTRNGRLVAVTMAKDEGPYVLEWVAYHRLLGFSDILAYTNDCTDGTDEMLNALASLGLVTRVDNPPIGTKPPQSRALMRAQKHPLVTTADWVMALDLDEFVAIRRGENRVDDLVDMVTQNEAGAVAITRRFFGSGGNAQYADQPVAARKEAGHQMKWVNGGGKPIDGQVMSWRQTRQTASYDFCQVNHYGVKSGEEYLMRRLRGDVLNNHGKYDDAYFEKFNRNDVTDHSALHMHHPLTTLIDELMTYPQVADAAKLVRQRYGEKLAKLRGSDEYRKQMQGLGFEVP